MASAIRAAFDAAAFVARVLRPRGLKGPRVPSRPLPRVPRTPRIAFAALALGVAATGVKEARAHTQRHHPRAPGPRELRFSSFASLRFQGRPYMTPSDFVDSVTRNSPRDDAPKRILTEKEVESILAKTPALDERRSQLFHSMGQNGLISYSDYLFLLCILTKPLAGFQIAFNMLDADGNQHIDKTEFLMMQEIFNGRNERRAEAGAEECATMPAASVKRRGDTTLLVHLFGRNGDKELDYQDFYRFTTALQEEVVWREFQACAHGRHVISEGAFARVLLRYTDVRDAAAITENLAARVPAGQGISFEEFHSFFQFLNNLEDFSIAVQMYTRAGLAIGQDEFRRAVRVATGLHLSPHLVCTVFHLFDEDGDGRLSHTEFLGVMRDRLRRGARDHRTSPKKDDYRTCVRRELSR
ncbi:calcium uptake protein 3, mitochondrial-like [Lampetra fluviatilis]